MSAFLSGEMRDTVEVNPAASYMLEKMFSRKERAGLFQGNVSFPYHRIQIGLSG
jgi:hypothetical protein